MPVKTELGWKASKTLQRPVEYLEKLLEQDNLDDIVDYAARVMHGTVPDITLSDDQKKSLAAIQAWVDDADDGDVYYLQGYAGTGKSYLASRVALQNPSLEMAFVAYTGKAASVLRKKLVAAGVNADECVISTVHKLMYKPVTTEDGVIEGWERREFLERDYDLIVVDEASMLPEEILGDLRGYGAPILLVGDPAQLPPVQGEEILPKQYPTALLSKIHRQGGDNPILDLAHVVRQTGDLPGNDWESPDRRVRFIKKYDMFNEIEQTYREVGVEETGILCYLNKTRLSLNELGLEIHQSMERTKERFFPGVPVVSLSNMNSPALQNGSRGSVLQAEIKQRWVSGLFDFSSEGVILEGDAFLPQFGREKAFNSAAEVERLIALQGENWRECAGLLFEYGYAGTVHKSQGSEYRRVYVIYERPPKCTDDQFRRWLYTACSRASEELVIVE